MPPEQGPAIYIDATAGRDMNDREVIDRLVLMLVSGVTPESAERAAVEKMGIAIRTAKRLIRKARQSITLAAGFNRDDEIGTAYLRLNDLFSRALKTQDTKTALAAQRELNRLMALYEQPPAEADDGGADAHETQELDLIRQHLLPLQLAPDTYPLHEHARIAADLVRQAKGV